MGQHDCLRDSGLCRFQVVRPIRHGFERSRKRILERSLLFSWRHLQQWPVRWLLCRPAKFNPGEWPNNGDDVDDSLTVTFGGSYDFEVVKIYLGAQYFDEVRLASIGGVLNQAGDGETMGDLITPINEIAKIKGYGISLTGDAPLGGGRAMFGVGYLEAEAADSMDRELSDNQIGRRDFDIKRYVVSVGYSYPFSKRTDVYGVASYMQDQTDTYTDDGTDEWDPSAYTVYVGLRHRF